MRVNFFSRGHVPSPWGCCFLYLSGLATALMRYIHDRKIPNRCFVLIPQPPWCTSTEDPYKNDGAKPHQWKCLSIDDWMYRITRKYEHLKKWMKGLLGGNSSISAIWLLQWCIKGKGIIDHMTCWVLFTWPFTSLAIFATHTAILQQVRILSMTPNPTHGVTYLWGNGLLLIQAYSPLMEKYRTLLQRLSNLVSIYPQIQHSCD